MKRYVYCVETEQGIFYGTLKALDEAQANRLLRVYLTNCGHKNIADVALSLLEGREEIQMHVFNLFTQEEGK